MTLYEELVDGGTVCYWIDESTVSNRTNRQCRLLEVLDDGAPVTKAVIDLLRDRYPILGLSGALRIWRERVIKV